MIPTTLIGYRLRSLRGARSQQKVANDLGVSVQAIGMWERAERIPRDETKVRLAEYYGSDVYSIFFKPEVNESSITHSE